MGVHSMVSHTTSKMRKNNAANSRTLGRWVRRVLGIAEDLDKSNDLVEQQKLQKVVASVAQQLADAEGSQPTENMPQFAPDTYLKRKGIICEADQTLNHFQPPPQGHTEEMQKAMSKDDRVLGAILKEISQADDSLLKEVTEIMPIIERSNERNISGNISPGGVGSQIFTSASLRTHSLQNEEKAYEQFGQKLAEYKQGNRGICLPVGPVGKQADRITIVPSIVIAISDMGSESGEAKVHVIPFDHTFSALVESFTEFNSDSFLPDFWAKASDPNHNCVTKSGVCWAWQDPSKKVIDAINKEGHMGLETVCKEVEYVVVLVKKGEVENGVPIEIPRTCRQRAFLHLQQHFPNHIVSQVRRLQLGDDVRDVVFDSRTFRHQTNPLFVELSALLDQPESLVMTSQPGDKGKGRANNE